MVARVCPQQFQVVRSATRAAAAVQLKERAILVLVRLVAEMVAQEEVLAQMVGTTRSRVNFFMKKFERLGFIDYKDGLTIRGGLLTVVLHEPDAD